MLRGSSVSAPRNRAVTTIAGAMLITAALASCSAPAEKPDPATSSAAPSPSASAAETPVLVPGGTATENLALFTAVTAQVWASDDRARGRAYVDALVAAGFPKERMQVTADRTTVGRAVESLQFSVAWGDRECLIGQVGPSTGEPVTAVMPQLGGGRCLVGRTRPIDW
ncbi:DUF6993 domain-containing protein [Microbacterium sp. 22195]|uniref:DUF6993 domain-containing protein n=1 Tax=Microbacterium sp. 22195 TaxID=3453891 RepID=UPI003F83A2B2